MLKHWLRDLGKAERLVLETLVAVYLRTMTKEALALQTGYAPDGGGFGNAMSRLRTPELIERRGELRAGATLCER